MLGKSSALIYIVVELVAMAISDLPVLNPFAFSQLCVMAVDGRLVPVISAPRTAHTNLENADNIQLLTVGI